MFVGRSVHEVVLNAFNSDRRTQRAVSLRANAIRRAPIYGDGTVPGDRWDLGEVDGE